MCVLICVLRVLTCVCTKGSYTPPNAVKVAWLRPNARMHVCTKFGVTIYKLSRLHPLIHTPARTFPPSLSPTHSLPFTHSLTLSHSVSRPQSHVTCIVPFRVHTLLTFLTLSHTHSGMCHVRSPFPRAASAAYVSGPRVPRPFLCVYRSRPLSRVLSLLHADLGP